MKRRHFVLGGMAAAVGGAALMRPQDNGMPYQEYFARLNSELKAHGPMRPSLVIDLDRLDHNIDQVTASISSQAGRNYRMVEKSLPSAGLLNYVSQRSGSKRFMSFHQPFLNHDARHWPDSDLLLGKPLPVRSAQLFYQNLQGDFDPSKQLQWLIDTPARLQQYSELAQALDVRMRINVEIDVGLHRGGVASDQELLDMIRIIEAAPQHLEFAGFMGYDPHIAAVPSVIASQQAMFDEVMHTYQHYVDMVRELQPQWLNANTTLNTAGSPTYQLHEQESLSTEISVGTGLLKPTHYDIPTLASHQPAVFIATPVLKKEGPVKIPGLDDNSRVLSWWDINQSETFFVYGGSWPADYHAPQGLQHNAVYGHSANQEIVNASPSVALQVDDQIFLRPHITEAVLLQFGDLIAVREGRIVDTWPVFVG
ncbi:MAG: alanine racemase [Oceanococcus sp.]